MTPPGFRVGSRRSRPAVRGCEEIPRKRGIFVETFPGRNDIVSSTTGTAGRLRRRRSLAIHAALFWLPPVGTVLGLGHAGALPRRRRPGSPWPATWHRYDLGASLPQAETISSHALSSVPPG